MAEQLALVTGASSGIGAALARLAAERGYDVALVARRADRLAALAQELGERHGCTALPIAADLSLPDAHVPIMAALDGRPVDLLVNNAGLSIPGPFAEAPWERQRDALMTLVMAVAGLTHAVLPDMIARRSGRIITISSIVALSQGGPGHTVYPAAKSFVHTFMLSLDAEVRRHGIVCTSVLPGTTASEFRQANNIAAKAGGLSDLFSQSSEAVARAAIDGNLRGRLIVIPGWHNQLAAVAMKIAPGRFVRWLGARIA
jgi:hypothetical protein